ncbi:hypothetical protein D9757_008224 [Collybiopsis confluens]|uniref:Amino acid permease/ SLC12A domain-containing protein n=1 Tax=Collybiopsis confluens TaxID=2823264 RepID=A0A8H5HBN5_9AGAR|nr:hypothetical protein D9757_008224 [Collybiopsis confluens]
MSLNENGQGKPEGDDKFGFQSPFIEDAPVFEEEKDLKRGLKQRHIQMIALAGTIGTGLFLGSGRALAAAGPLGLVLGYLLTGVLVSGVVMSIAELTALVPLTGSYVRHAEVFFDPALSFAIGWNTVYSGCVSIPAEITAAAVLISFWTTSVSNAVWITIMAILIIGTNVFFIRLYGELEFTFAILKISLIVGLIIMGLCIDLGGVAGQHRLGFEYWRNPGLFVQDLGIPGSLGRFLGFWTVFSNAAYAYSSIETFAAAAAETQNPRQNIPKAAKRVFARVLLFYVLSVLIISMIVPSNSATLANKTGNAAESPFVIAARLAGIKGTTRVLYGLANESHAPKLFLFTNRFGIPYVCVLFVSLFMPLAYMSLQSSASTVFGWFQDLVAANTLVTWITICLIYLRFYYGCKRQGINRKTELPWASVFQPYAAWIGFLGFSLILLTGGFSVFLRGRWDTETFFSSYFNIPLIFGLYFGYKVVRGTRVVGLDEMPIRHYINIANQNPEKKEPKARGWRRLNVLWW